MQKRLFHESSPADILALLFMPVLSHAWSSLYTFWSTGPKFKSKVSWTLKKFSIKFWTVSAWIFLFNFNSPPTAAVTTTAINKHDILSADSLSYFSHILPNCTQSLCSSNVFFFWQPFFLWFRIISHQVFHQHPEAGLIKQNFNYNSFHYELRD